MKRIVAIALWALLIPLAFSSCNKERVGDAMPDDNGMKVRVIFPQSVASKVTTSGTDVGTAAENRLDRVTILIFNAEGTELETALSVDVTSANSSLSTMHPKWASNQTLLVRPISNPATPKKIYAIANWSKTAFDKDTYTEAMLLEELSTIAAVADINGVKAFPILMCGSKAVPDLISLSYNVTVNMERQVSKIKAQLTVSKDIQDKQSQIEWQLDQMKITVFNVPDKSYVVGRSAVPSGIKLLNSTAIAVDDTKPAAADQQVPAIKDLVWSKSVYIYENPVMGAKRMDKAKSTYIVVQLPYKNRISGEISTDNCYKIHINDTRDALSPHKVLRNVIYNLNIRILGRGVPFDDLINDLTPDVNIEDVLTVVRWEDGEDINADFTHNLFNIDRTHLEFQSADNELKSTILTDVADWKLIKQDGSTIFSFAEGRTTYVVIDDITYNLSGTVSVATVTASKAANSKAFATQNMFFIAKNLKVPFTVAYDNGFIPNATLQAAGWPEHKLPVEGGLQIAKRGGILPSGIALDEDPKMQWKTESTTTFGVESITDISQAQLGNGKSSTDAMTTPSQMNLHPAAGYCRAMGPEWYLPSIAELKLIYNNASELGPSYSFITTLYRSASEGGSENWLAYLSNGNTSLYSKTAESIRVRCVRGTPPSVPDVGFIPNAALQAAGWPADRLPLEGGLQLAVRGNVLPGSIAANRDPQIYWSTVDEVTGITAKGFGAGKGNYAQLSAKDPATYPIGQTCKALGAEWYVPSQDEMEVIKKTQSILGPSYVLFEKYNSIYWSSTEGNKTLCWLAQFDPDHESSYGGKTNNGFARCVKGTTPDIPENGFIPNEVLQAGGWPVDKLPTEGGLQLATRGNILPGGTAAADDPIMQWSWADGEVTGIKATGLGDGKRNYIQLSAKDPAKYPIGQACKDLGPEWYVPSQEELKLIYNNRSMLTSSYSVLADTYWISSEKDGRYSWSVNLAKGSVGYPAKYESYRARCVKGTPPIPDTGFIPNEVLQAGGWPVDKLPIEGGLQIAKRGNISPDGVAANQDPQMEWNTWPTMYAIVGITHPELGKGSENYARLRLQNPTTYLIGQACKDLGPEWYVPSRDELTLISKNRSMMGPSYMFLDRFFWTCTERSLSADVHALLVDILGDLTDIAAQKNETRYVRCVKGTPPSIPDPGFIPNSVLQAGGWPVDKLPTEGGLQIAKRGNISPSGTAAADDQKMQWSTVDGEVTGITVTGLGDGKRNYLQLSAKDPAKYPIGQVCKHLGSEWYVPSKDELTLIYKNEYRLGLSYLFSGDNFWSSTESSSNSGYAWYMGFWTDSENSFSKSSSNFVRCVKGTPQPPIPTPTNSYIPRATLQDAGWPTDRLPKTGLQVAMCGNLLPGGTAAAEDPWIIWSTERKFLNFTKPDLGKGKDNYAKLSALDPNKYPINQACRHLGPEWYVPSGEELMQIYYNCYMLSAGYSFPTTNYWTSSEWGSERARYVNFSYEYLSEFPKEIDVRVRCVREI